MDKKDHFTSCYHANANATPYPLFPLPVVCSLALLFGATEVP